MVAAVVALLGGIALAAGGAFISLVLVHALRRRVRRQMWHDLVVRNQDLDRELDKIWRLR